MGANAQTTVPTFTLGQVLTANQMNQSARTGVPVFAGTAERDAAFGGSGEKTLAEGQLCYLESTDVVQYYDGSSWATVGPSAAPGLQLIKTQTIGTTVSSVTVTNAFSATYDNYRIVINGGTGSTSGSLRLQFGNAATAYYWAAFDFTYAGVNNSGALANTSSITLFTFAADGFAGWADVFNPFATRRTSYSSAGAQISTTGAVNFIGGYLNNTTSYTDFTLLTSTGTLTGGEIRVYGYRNS